MAILDFCPQCTKAPKPLTQSLLKSLIEQPWLQRMADEIAAGNLEKKKELPAACWQASFGGKRRSNQHARPSGLFALDVDHIDHPREIYQSFADRIDELGIYVVHITPSTHGLRIVARCREGLATIGEQQAWLAQQIGVEYDAVTRDFARLSFLVPASYFCYLNWNLFDEEMPVILPNPDYCEENVAPTAVPRPKQPKKRSTPTKQPTADTTGAPPSTQQAATITAVVPESTQQASPSAPQAAAETTSSPDAELPLTYHDVPYAAIVHALVQETGGEPQLGDRNRRLYTICRMLAYITDRRSDLIFRICPRFTLDEEEVLNCCKSACRCHHRERLPDPLFKVLQKLGIMEQQKSSTGDTADETFHSVHELKLPPLSHLPPLIREFTETAPEDFQPATIMTCLVICGFLGSRLRAVYIDGELQAPSFIVNIIAPAASGKSFLLRIPNICLAKIREQDRKAREQEAEYQSELKRVKNSRQKNKEFPQDPCPIIREVPAKISVAMLLKRMVQAQGLHLISITAEADTLTASNKAGAWSQKTDIYRVAIDNDGGTYGQDYLSDTSYSATCQMRYNMLTLGTPRAMDRAFYDTEDGLISRCIMVELPSQFGKELPPRKKFTAKQEQVVNQKIEELMRLSQDEQQQVLPEHHLSLEWLQKIILKWHSKQIKQSVRDEDHARDQFRRRAGTIAFRAGMLATVLWGEVSRHRMRFVQEFVEWVAEYMLRSLYNRYSNNVNEEAQAYEAPKKMRYPSLFDAVPEVFTLQDLHNAMEANGIRSEDKKIIHRWYSNGFIDKQKNCYYKLTE